MNGVLEGRSAIVTGASQGLGLEIARRYVAAGAGVLICGRDRDALNEARSTLQSACSDGQTVCAEVADVSDAGATERLVRVALDTFGKVDALVNNAGVYGPKGALEEIDFEEWKRAIEINLYGCALMCRAVIPHFRA
ncbi:MAG TPA: SDR family NAD(P)-dependent oxidoreductase, partial [Terriglobia bacterium]|nr:SDR family NAD(P)-dependent oxidoreductase [Terriglobia bacterium]